jgi:alkylated DNA repair dioxygenase AlkB
LDTELTNLGLILIPDFITCEEEQFLLSKIDPTNTKKIKTRNSIRRYGSNLPYKGNIVSKSTPLYFDFLLDRLVVNNHTKKIPESITVNEYKEGQEIHAHIDSKTSGDTISILSLLSDATMVFEYNKSKKSIILPSRSLVQMQNEIRLIWTHSILPVESLRYSLVFRCSE